jgi:long-chain acyl-CoA synthetase
MRPMASERLRIDINQTFQEHELILTGANGFLGKVVLGLLLDRFRDFKHLHVLLRPARNLSAQERFHSETLASPALAAIAEKRGKDFLRHKVTVWLGDISRPNCGMDAADVDRLRGRVSLIVNCAGRVDFFPPVDQSYSSNVDGVEHLVRVAKILGAKLLHVSTCYVCGQADGLVEETEPIVGFYPRRAGPDDTSFVHTEEIRHCRQRIRQIYDADGFDPNSRHGWPARELEGQGGRRSRELAERLIALGRQRAEHWGWDNTYAYAKSLGEQIIAAEEGLDYAIVRPAIVESASQFPFPGWIEGGRTAAPLVLMALGGMKRWPVRKDLPLEVVPVDLVASAIVVVSALLLRGRSERVYQLGTADVNPILLGTLVSWLNAEARKRQRQNGHRRAALIERLLGAQPWGRVRFVSAADVRARHRGLQKRIDRAQALIAGTKRVLNAARLPGERSLAGWSTALRTLGLQAAFRAQTLDQYLPFVLNNRYVFESENIRAAYALVSERDRSLLPWNPEQIDWKSYWVNHQIPGIERWVQPEAVKSWTFKI